MNSPDIIVVQSWFGPVCVLAGDDPVQHRPQRKMRGRRRYYRKIMREATRVAVSESDWYYRMHWHVDWPGLGNVSWRDRRSHLEALFVMFRDILGKTAGWTTPHECWLQIDALDSSQDAVYLHTPNPYRDDFPTDFDWVDWDVEIPERLREFITDPAWQFGRSQGTWTHFFVRLRPHS
ncbi:hypothetical protein [Longimicrobium terrae]|uniref:Uncharacterized protein n=1 Tax=Longimicrobium terrae TaxID=1639882 RepID=A0A841GMG4_9BACT|nr:hypothetical protein [Longimicrobium terrae]MBB4634618.1 hypothetical protein [Longimicrobium terrae]MBB6068492.1 hypothetical protein [Longimicrobium terrae]NNC27682.1 hypothetical protein [Longimicrobium terrae]